MTNEPLFIASPVSVLRGDAAAVALVTTNDAAWYTEGKGVLSVPLERWQQAQQYERETWLVHAINATDDRNAEHAGMFDDYKALPKNLGDVIELGCGPFTNWRIIQDTHTAKSVILLDPLADVYHTSHPRCAYRFGGEIDNARWPVSFVDKPIEEYTSQCQFDTIVFVNVLSHCQDAPKVFTWIESHLKKGGYLVFGEPARDIDPAQLYDAGHPLSYTQAVIDDFLKGFKQKYRKDNYFIGVKK